MVGQSPVHRIQELGSKEVFNKHCQNHPPNQSSRVFFCWVAPGWLVTRCALQVHFCAQHSQLSVVWVTTDRKTHHLPEPGLLWVRYFGEDRWFSLTLLTVVVTDKDSGSWTPGLKSCHCHHLVEGLWARFITGFASLNWFSSLETGLLSW